MLWPATNVRAGFAATGLAVISGYEGRNVIPMLQRLCYDMTFPPELAIVSCRFELGHYAGFDSEGPAMRHATNVIGLFPRFKAQSI